MCKRFKTDLLESHLQVDFKFSASCLSVSTLLNLLFEVSVKHYMKKNLSPEIEKCHF